MGGHARIPHASSSSHRLYLQAVIAVFGHLRRGGQVTGTGSARLLPRALAKWLFRKRARWCVARRRSVIALHKNVAGANIARCDYQCPRYFGQNVNLSRQWRRTPI